MHICRSLAPETIQVLSGRASSRENISQKSFKVMPSHSNSLISSHLQGEIQSPPADDPVRPTPWNAPCAPMPLTLESRNFEHTLLLAFLLDHWLLRPSRNPAGELSFENETCHWLFCWGDVLSFCPPNSSLWCRLLGFFEVK